MKKLLTLMLAVLMMLTACSKPMEETQEPENPGTEGSSVPEEQVEPEYEGPEHLAYLREDFPKIDGSTSLIPLEAGIRAEIFGKTIEEAALDVEHTTTWDSMNNLILGNVDIVFSVSIAEEQRQEAADAGITLEEVPVAMEGFVFVVNANNPVDVLTQEQLRDIYSGKITNWKEVGGNDAEIIAYQRNFNSGSQNYIREFMGDVPLMDAPTEKRPGSMAGLMNAIAVNDNAENAIGYSVYAYAADMYGNGDEIKFVKVDGAEVSKESMAKGEYPLMSYNYAFYRADEPEDSNVRKLVEWMLSDEGQLAIAKAGYVTIRDIGFDYSGGNFEKFEATGTGIEKPEGKLASYEYIAKAGDGYFYYENLPVKYENGRYMADFFKNNNLNDEINSFIEKALADAEKKVPEMEKYINARNTNSEWEQYTAKSGFWGYMDNENEHENCDIFVKAKNGYVWAMVTLPYYYMVQDGYPHYYCTETAIWDIESGKRLEISDIFYNGIDVDEELNRYLRMKAMDRNNHFYMYELKADFASLPESGWSITPEGIYLDYGNPYFAEGVFFDFKTLPEGILVTEQPKDMENAFSDSDIKTARFFRLINQKWDYRYLNEDTTSYALLPEDSYPTAKKINAEVMKHLNKYFTHDAIRKYAFENGYTEENVQEALWWSDWRAEDYGGKYVIFDGFRVDFWIMDEDGVSSVDSSYPCEYTLLFDIETGEKIEWQDMFLEGWEEHCSVMVGSAKVNSTAYMFEKFEFSRIIMKNHREMNFDMGEYNLIVDEDYIAW